MNRRINPPINPALIRPRHAPAATPKRRQLLRAALAAATGWGLGGCSPWNAPRVITLNEAELVDRVARLFPQSRRLLEVLDIELSTPRLRLLPESNRLALALWLRSRERLLGNAGHGQLAFDCALRWAPQDSSLRLTQVRVQQLWIERGAGPATPPTVATAPREATTPPARLSSALAEKVLEDLVIYRLGAEQQARLREAGLTPGAVTARGVEITLQRLAG